MVILLMKALLAPTVVLIASLLAARLGPHRGGIFIGLPTTSLPFMLVIWMSSGTVAAVQAAAGGLTGQLVCALFCITYARTATRLGALSATLGALAIAVALGFVTLGLHAPVAQLALVAVVAVVGLSTWPAQRDESVSVAARRGDIPIRMLVAGSTVVVTSGIEPHVGAGLAGALASLPMILMVMCPAVHAAQGPAHAVTLTNGTLLSIPGTAAYVCAIAILAPALGLLLAVAIGLAILPIANIAVARLGEAGAKRRRTQLEPCP